MRRWLQLLALLLVASSADSQALRFDQRRRSTPTPGFLKQTQLVDVTGDGVLDLVSRTPVAMRLFTGRPDGTFRDELWSLADSDADRGHVFFDCDGDQDLDLLVSRQGTCFQVCTDAQSRLFLDVGSGAPVDATGQLPATPNDPHGPVAAGDVDLDGDLDLVLGGVEFQWVDFMGFVQTTVTPTVLWSNDGTGTFTEVPGGLLPVVGVDQLFLADFDGDVDADLLVVDDGWLRYHQNLGGTFAGGVFPTGHPPSFVGGGDVTVFDHDGDGDLDLLASFVGTGQQIPPRLFENDGTGVLTGFAPNPFTTVGSNHVVGDFDADGDADVLVSGVFEARTYLGDGAGQYAAGSFLEGTRRHETDAGGDVDGDGDEDVLMGHELYLADGSGALVRVGASAPWAYPGSGRVLEELDHDNDGDLDVAAGNPGYAFNELYANDGSGRFAQVDAGAFTPNDSVSDLEAGDVDGDGFVDLACANRSGFDPATIKTNGPGGFSGTSVLPGSLGSESIVLGDVDGDGDLDALVGRIGQPKQLFANDGTGAFGLVPGATDGTTATPEDLALADLDADGALDLIDGHAVYLNSGGTFPVRVALHADPVSVPAVSVGDLDQDGAPDLLLGTYSFSAPSPTRLFLNDGTGAFSDASGQLPPNGASTTGILLTDVDGDGATDALLVNRPGTVLLRNLGAATFVDSGAPSAEGFFEALAAGDFDGDGDADAFVSSATAHQVLFDLGSQVNLRTTPSLGKPLGFDLAGPAFGGWVLAWSATSTPLPAGALGTLWLGPSALHVEASGPFDAAGNATYTTPLPAAPSLLGQTLFMQALVGPPLELSNLEVATITML